MYKLFISHSWNYNEHYNTIKEWLKSDETVANNMADYSVPLDDPFEVTTKSELKKKLTTQIALSNNIIIVSGMYAAYSEWIDYEIDEAVRLKKRIIGIRPWGQERIPTKIQDNATVMIGWNSLSLISNLISN